MTSISFPRCGQFPVHLAIGFVIFFGNLIFQAAEAAAFPLEVEHKFGKTAIPTEPQRIVTLGWNGEDAVLSLGMMPIAMPRYGGFPSGIFPWNEEILGSATPELLSGDLDFEAIAALRPDLILGVYSGINELEWRRLSTIAPTVVYRSGPWAADWREVMIQTGLALGAPDQAEQLLLETDGFLRKLGEDHPVLQGKTFTFGTFFSGIEQPRGLSAQRSPRCRTCQSRSEAVAGRRTSGSGQPL